MNHQSPITSHQSPYLTAQEAAAELGVSRATLYAYVSRGLIRSETSGADKRIRRYHAEDVRRLQKRKELRRHPEKSAQEALHWGMPVIESKITLIRNGQLYYRGQDAVSLASSHSVEEVARLIWAVEALKKRPSDRSSLPLFETTRVEQQLEQIRQAHQLVLELPPLIRFQALLPLMASQDVAAYDLRPEIVAQTGARILLTMTALAVNLSLTERKIAEALQQGWIASNPQASKLLNAALVLCADHELNVSSFTARCVASAGSTPYEVVQAGLAALQGTKHGGQTLRVEAFLREVQNPAGVRAAIANRLARGEGIPGFGHNLYPDGDPRCQALLGQLKKIYPNSALLALAHKISDEMLNAIGQQPTLDFALVILSQELNLPPYSALTLFALGRTIGWIGHAIEQYESNRLIRPRARYTGKQPGW
jgi:citrate synthase